MVGDGNIIKEPGGGKGGAEGNVTVTDFLDATACSEWRSRAEVGEVTFLQPVLTLFFGRRINHQVTPPAQSGEGSSV